MSIQLYAGRAKREHWPSLQPIVRSGHLAPGSSTAISTSLGWARWCTLVSREPPGELAAALYRLYPTRFRLDATLSLVGSRKVLAAIGSGDDPRDVIAMWRTELAAFENARLRYLLYPSESD